MATTTSEQAAGNQGTGESRATPGGQGRAYKWVALSNTTLAMTMATIDASIVIVAMPAIFRGIHLDPLAPGNVVFLLWIYVSSVILMYGVEFTAAYARLRRHRPDEMPAAPTPRV